MKKIKARKLKVGELIILEGRFYRIKMSNWNNGPRQGLRATLVLVNKDELLELITGQKNIKTLNSSKGGRKNA